MAKLIDKKEKVLTTSIIACDLRDSKSGHREELEEPRQRLRRRQRAPCMLCFSAYKASNFGDACTGAIKQVCERERGTHYAKSARRSIFPCLYVSRLVVDLEMRQSRSNSIAQCGLKKGAQVPRKKICASFKKHKKTRAYQTNQHDYAL